MGGSKQRHLVAVRWTKRRGRQNVLRVPLRRKLYGTGISPGGWIALERLAVPKVWPERDTGREGVDRS